jgi:CDP-glucose 4,6-dehydratase
MENMVSNFWQNKKVLLTGHTGFKGVWAALWLKQMGASVTGIALEPDNKFYDIMNHLPGIKNHTCDIRDRKALLPILKEAAPDIVIHMAAQSLVRKSYHDPLTTFETNILGTANILYLLRELPTPPQVVLVITSDKVYENTETGIPLKETDRFGGDDPYSASKACTEIVTASMRKSYFKDTIVATARAGNVIGGGDWSEDRLIPDIIRSLENNTPFTLRNPNSTRPWQHVLDVLHGYFVYIEALAQKKEIPLSLNFGPSDEACIPAGEIVSKMEKALGSTPRKEASAPSTLAEKTLLHLDSSLAAKALKWRPKLSIDESINWTASWYAAYLKGEDMKAFSLQQLTAHESLRP